MGYMGMDFMLDSNILKFAEPLGPGQIVDRQSLVILPEGYLKAAVEVENRRLILRVHGFQNQIARCDKPAMRPSIRTFYSIENHILQGRENRSLGKGPLEIVHEFDRSIMERLAFGEKEKTTPVREIVQICVYGRKYQSLIGMVHLAVEELLHRNSEEGVKQSWYKVFPQSSFTIGCPIACITPHCVNPCSMVNETPSFTPIARLEVDGASSRQNGEACDNCSNNGQNSKRVSFCESGDRIEGTSKLRSQSAPLMMSDAGAKKLGTYAKVAWACRGFRKNVQMRKSQAFPMTIDLASPSTQTCSSSSSSSIDIGYGSSSSSPNLQQLTSVSSVGSEQLTAGSAKSKIRRRVSTFTRTLGPKLARRKRRSLQFPDNLRVSEARSTSSVQRSEEIISQPMDALSFETWSHQRSTSDLRFEQSTSNAVRPQQGRVRSRTICRLSGYSEPEVAVALNKHVESSRSKSVRCPNSSAQHNTADAKTAAGSETGVFKKRSFKNVVSKWSRKRRDQTETEDRSSSRNRLSWPSKKFNTLKASLSYPPNTPRSQEPEIDNVYEVLKSLKKMSLPSAPSKTPLPSVARQTSVSGKTRETCRSHPVAEITIDHAPADAAAQNNCANDPRTRPTQASERVRSARKNFARQERLQLRSSSEFHVETRTKEQRKLSVPSFNQADVSDDDEYLSCNDGSVFTSAASSLESLHRTPL